VTRTASTVKANTGKCYSWVVDREEILRVLRAFEGAGLEHVLIGAAAMGIHGVVRATEGLDLFIRATAETIDRLKRAFRITYDSDPNIDEISADDLLGDYPAVRYYPPSGDLYFDVIKRVPRTHFHTYLPSARDGGDRRAKRPLIAHKGEGEGSTGEKRLRRHPL